MTLINVIIIIMKYHSIIYSIGLSHTGSTSVQVDDPAKGGYYK